MISNIKSKLSSLSKPKLIGLLCCIFLISGVVMMVLLQIDIPRDVKNINSDGDEGKALVVFRPGLSFFQEDMINGFVEGLEDNDWSVDVTTASSKTPTDVDDYDLLVLGSPTYAWRPHGSILDYLEEVGDLDGMDVAIIVTSGGSDDAQIILEDTVEDLDGDIVESLSLYQSESIAARETCYKAGKSLEA